jgi:hypothetical protein
MQYHIQTTPIWDTFKSGCGCPMCKLYEEYCAPIVGQYAGNAVMEPSFREKVNKTGFCDKHFNALFVRENKLGLSLQLGTRIAEIIKNAPVPKTAKDAVRQSESLQSMNSSCVVCEEIDKIMERFAYTTAQMFLHEAEFESVLKGGACFCVPHYILLIKHSARAGAKQKQYLEILNRIFIAGLEKSAAETDRFSNMFDHRSEGRIPNADTIIPNAINLLRGEIIK